jgi:hypothetical protein
MCEPSLDDFGQKDSILQFRTQLTMLPPAHLRWGRIHEISNGVNTP